MWKSIKEYFGEKNFTFEKQIIKIKSYFCFAATETALLVLQLSSRYRWEQYHLVVT